MNNAIILVLVVLAVLAGGFVAFLAINSGFKTPPPLPTCVPTNSAVPSAPGAIEEEALVNWHDGLINPKVTHVKGPVIFLTINNSGYKKHNFVLAQVAANCQETVLRSIEGVMNAATQRIRIQLNPGHYLLYCDIREGESSHRALGEVATIIVH
jgi:hypothetical protein